MNESMKTANGLAVSTHAPGAVDAIERFQFEIISSGQHPDIIIDAAQQYPDCVLIQIYAAMFYLYAQENAATTQSIPYLIRAEKHLEKANFRERLLFNAVQNWQALNYQGAITDLTALVHLYPQDTLAVKVAEWIFYCLGQAYSATQFKALCDTAAPHQKDNPYFLASHSFALELTGHYPAAMAKAEQAMDLEPIAPWAHHTIAHCLLLNGEMNQGAEFLQSVSATWKTIMPLLKGHNNWHLALFYLAHRDVQKVLERFKHHIFGLIPGTILEQIDAISLLWRLEMAGFAQDQLLQQVRSQLNHHPYEYYTGFNAIHLIYCLTRANDDKLTNHALDQMQHYTQQLPAGAKQDYWQFLCLPFCKATAAFAKHDYQSTIDYLNPIIQQCFKLGGSDAQDELFLQMYFVSLIQCKQQNRAKMFFNQYLKHYNNTHLGHYWFTGLNS